MLKKYKDFIILLVCLIAIYQLYLYTTFPAFKSDDSAETITSAYTLGISHPPGYPLYTIVGKVFSYLPLGSPAFRVNLFAIFLAIIVLLLFYYLTKSIIFKIFNYENKIINFLGVFLLASSYMYWNQAIEAKGGIYILNLLFLSALMFLSLRLLDAFDIKYLYFIIYIFGLSLTNHWPSVIIFLPFLSYFFYKYREKLNLQNYIICLLFLFVGLSVYLYLLIRSRTENIFVLMIKPDNLENLFRMIFLRDYGHAGFPTIHVKNYHIKEMLNLFFINIYLFLIFAIFGFYSLRRVKKEISFLYLSILALNLFIVTFSVHLTEQFEWSVGTFLMPSLYLLASFSINGIYTVAGVFIKKIHKNIFLGILIVILLYVLFLHFKINDERYNYLSYDFGSNEIKTIDPGSLYIPASDFYEIPLGYYRNIEHRGNDFNYVNFNSLQTKWGIKDFIKKYGYSNLKEHELTNNTRNIIINFISKGNFYFSYPNDILGSNSNYVLKAKGLLYKVSVEKDHMPSYIFKIYSYRNIYDVKSYYDKLIASLYGERMAMQAKDFLKEKNFIEAKKLYDKALIYAEKSDEEHMYFNIAWGYNEMGYEGESMKCLKKSIAMKNDDWQAYAALGMIYYNEKILPMAEEMFEKAVQYGSDKKELLQTYINAIRNGDATTQYEVMFNQATSLLSKGEYDNAMDIYEFLLNKNYYRTVDIYKNIGVYNFQTNNFNEALKYFQKAKERDKNAAIYSYIAYTYYKLGQAGKALNTLREAMQIFGNDPRLENLYNQIEQAEGLK